MNSTVRVRWPTAWFYGFIGVCVLLLITTVLRIELGELTGKPGVVELFTFRGENSVATWWSGALFMLAGVFALDGYYLLRRSRPRPARGWLLIGLVLFILSADEIGSFHERADQVLHLGDWGSRVPFAIILFAMLGYGLGALWSAEDQRARALLILLAMLVQGGVAFQEFLEHRIEWGRWDSLRGLVEEGSELLGAMILLKVSAAW